MPASSPPPRRVVLPPAPEDDDDDVRSRSSSEYEPDYEPEWVTVGSTTTTAVTLSVLSLVPPPLEYMSTLHTAQEEISGRQIWCGSLLLTEFMLHHHQNNNDTDVGLAFRGKRILELGSGTGLLGMTVARTAGPACVAMTDGDAEAVGLMVRNIENNDCDTNVLQADLLRWGHDDDDTAAFDGRCRSYWPRLWPSKEEEEDVTFDFILAGDVLYKRDLPSLFFATVRRFLCTRSDAAALYLCHVPRAHVDQQVVREAAEADGFKVEQMDLSTLLPHLPDHYPHDDIVRAAIYRITLPTLII